MAQEPVAIVTPQQRRALIDLVWDRAIRKVEGPDNQGGPVPPEECWTEFTNSLNQIGLELDLRQIDANP